MLNDLIRLLPDLAVAYVVGAFTTVVSFFILTAIAGPSANTFTATVIGIGSVAFGFWVGVKALKSLLKD